MPTSKGPLEWAGPEWPVKPSVPLDSLEPSLCLPEREDVQEEKNALRTTLKATEKAMHWLMSKKLTLQTRLNYFGK